MKNFFIFLILVSQQLFLYSQTFTRSSLHIFSEFNKAYEKSSRSYDGKPGKNYWINKTIYKIRVKFDPSSLIITGKADIIYKNNSPDTLDRIVLRCYPDFYKYGNMRDWQIPKEALTEGLEFKEIQIRTSKIKLNDTKHIVRTGTNAILNLNQKLLPRDSIDLKIEWEYKFPKERGIRMGVYRDSSYFIAYWYPQVAVYDDIYGWDNLHYTGTTEFYNDFNDYHVEITVPNNYFVWATGECLNYEETLNPNFVEKIDKARKSDEIIPLLEENEIRSGAFTKKKDIHNIWKFRAHSVPDFAFALSSSYLCDITSVVVDSSTNRRTLIFVAYDKTSHDFKEVANISKKSLEYFSFELPGVAYPYPTLTVFNGAGGMEYPMMANNGSFNEKSATVHVTTHEIFHTYFPFFMGTNERRFAFMDEGWAVAIPFDLQFKLAEGYDPRAENIAAYNQIGGSSDDFPPMVQSQHLRWGAYRQAAYRRPSIAYDLLRNYLGEDKFKFVFREYIKLWNGKHPTPYDFFFLFNSLLKEDLNWFWQKWFFEFCYADLAIESVIFNKNDIKVRIVNLGKAPVSICVRIYYDENNYEEKRYPMSVFKDKNYFEFKLAMKKKPYKITIGDKYIPDVNQNNNIYYLK